MDKFKIVIIVVLSCLLWIPFVSAQITDPENPDLNSKSYEPDNMYFHVGAYYGLSQPVATDLKKISLSGPIDHQVALTYEKIFKMVIERRGLKQYLETELLVTDLFPEAYTSGKTVFIVYKEDKTIEDYLALKKYKQGLVSAGKYDRNASRDVATRFAKFFSYTNERTEQNIGKNGPQ